jgi:hypothetical protein
MSDDKFKDALEIIAQINKLDGEGFPIYTFEEMKKERKKNYLGAASAGFGIGVMSLMLLFMILQDVFHLKIFAE